MDLVDRQAILKNIEKIRRGVQMMDDTRRASLVMSGMYLCEKAVRNQPSAESAQKTGQWIPEFEGKYTGGAYWFRCSCCGKLVPGGLQSGYRHCPNCGSLNRGEEE